MDGVYISADNIQKCKCCGRKKDTREGFCFDCAEGENIIADGFDMYDRSLPQNEHLPNNSEEMNRLKFLVLKGWTPPKKTLRIKKEIVN